MGRVAVQIEQGASDEDLVKAFLLVLDQRGVCPCALLDVAADNAGVELLKASMHPSSDRVRIEALRDVHSRIMAFYEDRVIPSMLDGITRILDSAKEPAA